MKLEFYAKAKACWNFNPIKSFDENTNVRTIVKSQLSESTNMCTIVKSQLLESTNMRTIAKSQLSESTNMRTIVKSQSSESTIMRTFVKNTIFAGMEQTKYTQIPPAGMFKVTVERTVKHDSRTKMHYEFAYTVEASPTENDFINLFASLVIAHGKCPATTYAAMLGVGVRPLETTLATLTGAGFLEWTDAFVCAVAEPLLRETDWQVGRIAQAAGFGRVGIFSRWFRSKYKCTPLDWRYANR
ncbi:MAG: helix-turn-helix domain-containing protein [Bacteroidales bacterium]|jgi:AraC-like DNA-binding protein|nr:helix-turn-helix domain-containing protein [Bacteroidales bacterium]